MSFLNEETNGQVREFFEQLTGSITLTLFTSSEAEYSDEIEELTSEIATLSNQLSLDIHNLDDEPAAGEKYGIDRVPALVILDEEGRDFGIRYYGLPTGYEFGELIQTIAAVDEGVSGLNNEAKEYASSLDDDLLLQVFVTPT